MTRNTLQTIGTALFMISLMLFSMPDAFTDEAPIKVDNQTYTLTTCPVTGAVLGSMGDPVVETINEREVRFCCPACPSPYREDLEKYEGVVDAAIIEAQKAEYPVDRCVVMDVELGSMGEPIDYVHGNRLVRFCCAGCVGMFEANPDTYLEKLDAAVVEQQLEAYPLDTCVVTGEPLGDSPVKLVIANTLVLLHSDPCVDDLRKNPSKYLDKISDSK